ncbi:M14 family metallopeptidase [Aliidiomarina soli]|uniref:Peptidase n=1 Tax=Aliidiomarina soli TaxID=1928574 RepID=A0A432WLL1_9GAMM|nr:M14 family metallocarboxypeptidase [Aliidiomarina soli]RUO34569.1 peptidase [Aliidiomarina soli]
MSTQITSEQRYAIGTPGQPWGAQEKADWLAAQEVKRSYQDEVVSEIERLAGRFDVHQYGELDYQAQGASCYPLYALTTVDFDLDKPTILVTGGVHGYETSGVHGALRFLELHAEDYSADFNIIVAPCISPWGYETINRWNVFAVDPNRSFIADSPAPEAAQVMEFIQSLDVDLLAHIDLHETTDTDNSEFRPALAARDGKLNTNWNIPDGFYLVGNSAQLQPEFQAAIIRSVEQVTHIAEPDEEGRLIGTPMVQPGVVEYEAKPLGLCMGLSQAQFVTTTEVYPDSANATPEQCVNAQVAAVTGALDFLR